MRGQRFGLVWIVSFGLVTVGVVVLFRLIRGLVLGFLGLSWLLEILVGSFAWFVLSAGSPRNWCSMKETYRAIMRHWVY